MTRTFAETAFLKDILRTDDTIEAAVRTLMTVEVPALPVVDEKDRYVGIFGETEFMTALFPGYVGQLKGARFLVSSLDRALEKRDHCRVERIGEYVNAEHVEVGPDFSDLSLAEIFLHHGVSIVPVVDDDRRVAGIVPRRAFFRTLAERFVQGRE